MRKKPVWLQVGLLEGSVRYQIVRRESRRYFEHSSERKGEGEKNFRPNLTVWVNFADNAVFEFFRMTSRQADLYNILIEKIVRPEALRALSGFVVLNVSGSLR
jgi:hypothetical protein